ncbi:MAG: serine/threonine-protein phosphatase [Spirochaetales bacterium]|nr:serine/threonine-protein phosphatase [Spirochaetales bacterium]
MNNSFIEMDSCQITKGGQRICGDVFLLERVAESGRVVATLSDGMGSGVKANVLANLTAGMGQRFALAGSDMRKNAEAILNTLPVCRERKISYATFTLADIQPDGSTHLVEYDNPLTLWVRGGTCKDPERRAHIMERPGAFREEVLQFSHFSLQPEDRLVICSDGVAQSGMGTKPHPLGWRESGLRDYVEEILSQDARISARDLAKKIAQRAVANDGYQARDDISCVVAYARTPRKLLVATGPPYEASGDAELAQSMAQYPGKRAICGGTTASIISREWNSPVHVNLDERDRSVPPSATLEGADLVTEGMLTLGKTAELLENRWEADIPAKNAAEKLTLLLRESDEVSFVVGTRINEAHHDPTLPFELGIRRTLIDRIRRALELIYLKKTDVTYV